MALLSRFEPSLVDLEIESLLLEAIHDPRARLFRATRAQVARERLERNPCVGPNSPGLLAVERKLLSSYRDEAAYLLRRAYHESLFEDLTMRRVFLGEAHAAGGRRARATSTLLELDTLVVDLRQAFPDPFVTGEIEEAARCRARPIALGTEILAASIRLVPDWAAFVYTAYDAFREGDHRAAGTVAARIAACSTRKDAAIGGMSILGLIASRRGELRDAALVFGQSARVAPEDANTAFSWFTASVQAGTLREVRRALDWVDGCWSGADSVTKHWVEARLHERRDGVWAPTSGAGAIVRSIRAALGPVTRELTHVFQ